MKRYSSRWGWFGVYVCFFATGLVVMLALPKLVMRFPHHMVVDDFKSEGGNLYRLFIPPDIVQDHELMLLENGREVGERIPMRQVSRIIEEGGGLYAQGEDTSTTEYRYLYLSASDNSDPRTNQYVYEIVYNPSVFRLGLLIALWTVLAAAGAFKQVYEWRTGGNVMDMLDLRPVQVLYTLLYGIIIAAILAYGLLLRYNATLLPLLEPDSISYLAPAISGQFDTFRGYPYPVFLKLCLDMFADFKALNLAQYGLGLTTAVLLLAAWRKPRPLVPGKLLPIVHDGIGILLLISWYISRTTMYYEKAILVEGFQVFLFALLLYTLASFAMQTQWGNSGMSLILTTSGTAILNILAFQAHGRWGLGMLVIALCLLLFIMLSPISRRTKTSVLALSITVSALLMILPQRYFDPINRSSAFSAQHLIFMHLDIVDRQLAQDLADPDYDHFDRAFLADFHAQNQAFFARQNFREGMRFYSSLGDLAMYSSDGPIKALSHYFQSDWLGYARFCSNYFLHTILNQPQAYLNKVTDEVKGFYLDRGIYSDLTLGGALGNNPNYQSAYLVNTQEHLQKACADFFEQSARKAEDKLMYSPKTPFIEWVYLLNISFRPIFIAALASCVLSLFTWKRLNRLAPLIMLFILAELLLFSQVLTIAMSHSFAVYRYGEAIRIFSLFSQASGLMILLAVVTCLLDASKKNLSI